jgi:hypothetical protein
MRGHIDLKAIGARAADAIAGDSVCDRVLTEVQAGCIDPDAILRGITKALALDGVRLVPGDALRAFAGRIQKTIEEARDAR